MAKGATPRLAHDLLSQEQGLDAQHRLLDASLPRHQLEGRTREHVLLQQDVQRTRDLLPVEVNTSYLQELDKEALLYEVICPQQCLLRHDSRLATKTGYG